jgi:O-acetyl-ADP-ribose deacetylase (regulator of RNase III)
MSRRAGGEERGGEQGRRGRAMSLPLAAYRAAIELDDRFERAAPAPPGERSSIARTILRHLLAEAGGDGHGAVAERLDDLDDVELQRQVLFLLTIRPPEPLPEDIEHAIDRLLALQLAARDVVPAGSLPRLDGLAPGYPAGASCALWQGDITTLAADAIVNAANEAMLGCFVPFHPCVDNAIHTAAGPRLRADCGRIMTLQAHPEPTAQAKATRAYNLPSRFVLHTVGPVVRGELNPEHELLLGSAYRACLDLGRQLPGVRTIAFCAISTGLFGFPKPAAARIALATTAEWLGENPGVFDLVVFTAFGDRDREAYEAALGAYAQ